uniref:Ig-like domain-containing protein n=1 Tax=Haplochromis burtoni TaxID=8153 RepID=A0A3Q2VGP1_HAPBU
LPRSSPFIQVEIPSFKTVITSNTDMQATCLVHTYFDATITWLIDGKATFYNCSMVVAYYFYLFIYSFFKLILFFIETPSSSQLVEVYVQGPPPQLTENKGYVTITCLLVGPNLNDFAITWRVGGSNIPESYDVLTNPPVSHNNGTETRQSFLNMSAVDWDAHTNISCEGKRPCSNHGNEDHISKSKGNIRNVTNLSKLHVPLSDNLTLVCLVSEYFPANIIVHWEEDGQTLPPSHYVNSPPWKYSGSSSYSMSSWLNISKTEAKRSTYSCVVTHENSHLGGMTQNKLSLTIGCL